MSTAPHLCLPATICAATMIIRSQRGSWRLLLDGFLTALAWLTFVWLFGRSIWAIVTKNRNGIEMPLFSEIFPTLSDLSVYVVVMLLHGALLILWARYNYWRFRGKQRRSPITPPLTQMQLMSDYGITCQTLQQLRSLRIATIHHAQDGHIIQTSRLHSPQALPASKGPETAAHMDLAL